MQVEAAAITAAEVEKATSPLQFDLAHNEKSSGRRIRRKKYLKTRKIILETLSDGQLHSLRDFARFLGRKRAHQGLLRSWKSGFILRTRSPLIERESVSHGKLGCTTRARLYHPYLGRSERNNENDGSMKVNELDFVPF